jgi:hypothetical protein
MKIDFTKREYRTLLEILEIANWVLHAHKVEKDPRTKKYRDLEQKIFSHAKDLEFEHLIKYAAEYKQYFPTRKYEDTSPAMKFVEEFENDSFWDELVDRLVIRDIIRQEGKEKLLKMSLEERFEKEDPIREKYYREFEEHGIERIRINPI